MRGEAARLGMKASSVSAQLRVPGRGRAVGRGPWELGDLVLPKSRRELVRTRLSHVRILKRLT